MGLRELFHHVFGELSEKLFSIALTGSGSPQIKALELLLRISREEREIQLMETRQAEKMKTSELRLRVAEKLERLAAQGKLPASLMEPIMAPIVDEAVAGA